MIINYKGFFSWQGNEQPFLVWVKWLVLGMAFLIMILLWIFKEKIAKRFDGNRKILFFKDQNNFWRTVGVVGTIILLARIVLYWIFGYPLYWEGLSLHLCRLHILLMMLLMAFGKVKWIKHFTYLAVMGAIFGIAFNNSHSDLINRGYDTYVLNANGDPVLVNGVKQVDWNHFKTLEEMPKNWTQLEKMSYLDKIAAYGTGYDNVFFYEFILAHLGLVFFPLFVRAAYRQKVSNLELYRMQIGYIFMTIFLWTLNTLTGNVADHHWRANNWYMGLDANNDQVNTLGILSHWPQNLFSYLILGYGFTWSFHLIWFATSKVRFFESDKWYKLKIIKSQPWQDCKNGFYKGWFKEIFIFKRQ